MNNDHHGSLLELYDAILKIDTKSEVKAFFTDLCTPAELKAMQERWKVCQFLDRGDLSYRDIQKATKASLTTIGRVSRFLKEENYYGYRNILEKIKKGTNENT
jgi:TrpR-related protein YerC/YecD